MNQVIVKSNQILVYRFGKLLFTATPGDECDALYVLNIIARTFTPEGNYKVEAEI